MIGEIDRAIVEMIKKADRISLVIGDVRIQLENDGKLYHDIALAYHSACINKKQH